MSVRARLLKGILNVEINLVILTLTACQKLCGGVCLGTIGIDIHIY